MIRKNIFNAVMPNDFVEVKHTLGRQHNVGFNFYINNELYSNMNSLEVVCMTSNHSDAQKSFYGNFLFPHTSKFNSNTVNSNNNKYFNRVKNDTGNNFINYNNQNIGKNSMFSSVKNKKTIFSFTVDKGDIINTFSNYYKVVVSRSNSNSLFAINNNKPEFGEIFVFIFKDQNKNVLWSSEPIAYNKSLYALKVEATEMREIYDNQYLYAFYKNQVLNNSSVIYNPAKGLYVYLPQINNLDIQNAELDFSIIPRCIVKYGQSYIPILTGENNNSINVVARRPAEELYLDISGGNFFNTIIEDYENNNIQNFKFEINAYLEIISENGTYNYVLPVKEVVLNRTDSSISSLYDNEKQKYIHSIHQSINCTPVAYIQKNKNKIRHEIQFDFFQKDFRDLKILDIKINNISVNAIYYESDSNLEEGISLYDINNVSNILNNTGNSPLKGIFYTYTYNNSPVTNISYYFKYDNTIIQTNEKVISADIVPYISQNEDDYFKNSIRNLSQTFKNQIDVKTNEDNINIDLDSTNYSLINIDSINLLNIDTFKSISLEYGYSDVKEFLKNCVIKINKTNNFQKNPVPAGERNIYYNNFEKFFEIKNIFNFESSENSSNILGNNVIIDVIHNSDWDNLSIISFDRANLQFLNNHSNNYTIKQDKFNIFDSSIDNFYYTYLLSIKIIPIHNLVYKYKNAGLDNDFNVRNIFNNQEEADGVNRIFYDFFYSIDPSLNYDTFITYKKSFFVETENINVFYTAIFSDIFDSCISYHEDVLYKKNLSYDKNYFRSLIEEKVLQLETTREDLFYGFEYLDKMIPDNISSTSEFVDESYKISSPVSFSTENVHNIDLNFNYDSIIKLNAGFLNDIRYYENSNNEYTVDLRMCIVPYFSSDAVNPLLTFDGNESLVKLVNINSTLCLCPKSLYYITQEKNHNFISGYYQNNISKDSSGNICIDFNCLNNLDKLDIFNNNYKQYFDSFYNLARLYGYNKLYEITLNICAIVTFKGVGFNEVRSGLDVYYSKYDQIKLLNLNQNIEYEKINNIIFTLV